MHTAPNIFYFNPTCEMALANGTVSWQPNRLLQQFETDLELIVAFLAQPDDVALLRKLPSNEHITNLKAAGLQFPQLLHFETALKDQAFISRPKNLLKPWGWSPVMHRLFRPLISSTSISFQNSKQSVWRTENKDLYSRLTARKVLLKILERKLPGTTSQEVLPVVIKTIDELTELFKTRQKLVLKAPWSSSGRGIQIIDYPTIDPYTITWSKSILKEQGYLMVEPLLKRKKDFAFQFEISEKSVDYLGASWFYTNDRGAYLGNYLSKEAALLSPTVKALFEKHETNISEALKAALSEVFLGYYQGIAGVDAMFVEAEDGSIEIHPCLEINLRYNMGNVAVALSHFAEKGYTSFEISTNEAYETYTPPKIRLTEGDKFCAFLCKNENG